MVQDLNFRITVTDTGTAVVQKFGNTVAGVGAKATVMGRTSSAAFASIGKRARGVIRSVINLRTAFIGLIAAVAIRKLVTTIAEFENRMLRVGAITGVVGKQFEQLEAIAIGLGESTVFTATEAAGAMEFLARAGFQTNEIIGATPKVLELAAAGMIDLSTSADIVTNIMAGLGLEIDELGRANDVLVKTFTSSNVNLQQLGEAFKLVGPIGRAAGVEFETLATAIGLLGNAGLQGSIAGTSLRRAFAKLLKPTDEAAKIIKNLGVQITTSEGRLRPFSEILRGLEPIANNATQVIEVFGVRAGPGMAALLSQGADAFEELERQLRESAGTAAAIAERQISGLAGQIKLMKSAFDSVILSMRKDLGPLFITIANKLRDFFLIVKTVVNVFGDLRESMGGVQKAKFGEFLDNLIPSVETLIKGIFSIRRGLLNLETAFISLNIIFTSFKLGVTRIAEAVARNWNALGNIIAEGNAIILSKINAFIAKALGAVGDTLIDFATIAGSLGLKATDKIAGALFDLGSSANDTSVSFQNTSDILANIKIPTEPSETAIKLRNNIVKLELSLTNQKKAINDNTAAFEQLKNEEILALAITRDRTVANKDAASAAKEQEEAERRNIEARLVAQRTKAAGDQQQQKTLAELLFPPDDTSIEARVERITALFKRIPVTAGQAILESIQKVEGGLEVQAAALEVRLNAELQQRATAENQKRLLAEQTIRQEIALEQAKFQLQQALFGPGGLAQNLINSGSKKAFKVGKALMLANATAGALLAIVQALAAPFPLNIILPPIVAANAFLQVRQIAAMKFGGGARSASVSLPSISSLSSQARAPDMPDGDVEERRPQIINITVAGFIGNEALLASELGRIIDEGGDDGISFGLNTSG